MTEWTFELIFFFLILTNEVFYLSGTVVKLRNNLTEYSPTDAMTVLVDGDNGYLFCSGFDIDRGCGYINGR